MPSAPTATHSERVCWTYGRVRPFAETNARVRPHTTKAAALPFQPPLQGRQGVRWCSRRGAGRVLQVFQPLICGQRRATSRARASTRAPKTASHLGYSGQNATFLRHLEETQPTGHGNIAGRGIKKAPSRGLLVRRFRLGDCKFAKPLSLGYNWTCGTMNEGSTSKFVLWVLVTPASTATNCIARPLVFARPAGYFFAFCSLCKIAC